MKRNYNKLLETFKLQIPFFWEFLRLFPRNAYTEMLPDRNLASFPAWTTQQLPTVLVWTRPHAGESPKAISNFLGNGSCVAPAHLQPYPGLSPPPKGLSLHSRFSGSLPWSHSVSPCYGTDDSRAQVRSNCHDAACLPGILAPPFSNCLTLDRSHNLSGPQFPKL